MTNEITFDNLPVDRAEVLAILHRFADWAKDRDDREFTSQLHGQISRIENLPAVDTETARDVIAELKLRLWDREQRLAQNVLRWTSDKPTVPGWYWYRTGAGDASDWHRDYAFIIRVDAIADECLYVAMDGSDVGYALEDAHGQFAGPIQEPV